MNTLVNFVVEKIQCDKEQDKLILCAIEHAAKNDRSQFTERYQSSEPDLDTFSGETALTHAMFYDYNTALELMKVMTNEELEVHDGYDRCAFTLAIEYNEIRFVEYLLNRRISIPSDSYEYAIELDRDEIAELIANAEILYAVERGDVDLVKTLLERSMQRFNRG
jgi:hypothetical protein